MSYHTKATHKNIIITKYITRILGIQREILFNMSRVRSNNTKRKFTLLITIFDIFSKQLHYVTVGTFLAVCVVFLLFSWIILRVVNDLTRLV